MADANLDVSAFLLDCTAATMKFRSSRPMLSRRTSLPSTVQCTRILIAISDDHYQSITIRLELQTLSPQGNREQRTYLFSYILIGDSNESLGVSKDHDRASA